MPSFRIVEPFDVIKDISSCFIARPVSAPTDSIVLQPFIHRSLASFRRSLELQRPYQPGRAPSASHVAPVQKIQPDAPHAVSVAAIREAPADIPDQLFVVQFSSSHLILVDVKTGSRHFLFHGTRRELVMVRLNMAASLLLWRRYSELLSDRFFCVTGRPNVNFHVTIDFGVCS